tara:strand:- start:62 stop:520 length:459 start_codon:yes stop_codon:yes gene_type:complete
MYGTEIVLFIILAIFLIVGFSALGGLILWGCARGIGGIEKSTFLNSWGLYWILTIVQFFIFLIWYGILFAIGLSMGGSAGIDSLLAVTIITLIIVFAVSIWAALGITKAFWQCTWHQSFMTHLVPMILYTIMLIIEIIIFLTAADAYWYWYF